MASNRTHSDTPSILRSFIVTIDGSSGSGKSTTARAVADRLGLLYLDTGAMYRGVTYKAISKGIALEDGAALGRLAGGLVFEFKNEGERLFVDGEDVSREIRSPEVSAAVSIVSAHPEVRKAMVRLQRRFGERGGIVVEGRDVGSVVFPHAHAKFFMVADLEVRASRRQAQLEGQNLSADLGSIRQNLRERDRTDSSRDVSPLIESPGAMHIDTGALSFEEQVDWVAEKILARAGFLENLRLDEGRALEAWNHKNFFYNLVASTVRVLMRTFFGARMYGQERIRYAVPMIFASNHISYLDPPFIGSMLPREILFVSKAELFRIPVLGWLIKRLNAIPLRRGSFDRKALDLTTSWLEQGRSILVFPEGTRFPVGRPGPAKAGVGMLAEKAGVPVVPIFLRGTNHLLRALWRRPRMELHIGDPIWIGPLDAAEGNRDRQQRIADMVMQAIEQIQTLLHD